MTEKLTSETIDQAPDVTAADVVDHKQILNDLAKLSPMAYDQCREEKAKLLGIRISTLDAEVKQRRPRQSQPDAQGKAVSFDDPQLWLLEVEGADLLSELAEVYSQHIILMPGGAEALALW